MTNTVDGNGAGSTSYITDLSNHGVAVQTISPNGRKTYYENYTDTLKAQTIRTYRDAAETVPVAYAITYDELGNALTVLAPDGVLTTNTYAAGKDWLTSQTLTKGGAVLNKIVYTYDDGCQIVLVHPVGDQLVMNFRAVQQTGRIRLAHFLSHASKPSFLRRR